MKFQRGMIPSNKRIEVYEKSKEIVSLYKEGLLSMCEISNKFNCSRKTIRNILILENVNLRKFQTDKTKNKIALSRRQWAYNNPLKDKERIEKMKVSKRGKVPNIEHLFKKGMVPWNKGLTSERDNRLLAGSKHYLFGKNREKSTISKIKEKRALQITPTIDTTIEVKIQNFLDCLKIEYFTHKYMNIEHGYQCDIFIPSMNFVIECDGNYWHKYPTGREIDHIRTSELIEKGFKVLRLWESEIKEMNVQDFKNKIEEGCYHD